MKAERQNAVPTDVYLSFVSSLFGNRKTLFTGMVIHILTYLAVYAKSGATFYIYLTAVFVLICAYRIYWFHRFDEADKSNLTRSEIAEWELLYLYGGVATTTVLGVGSGYAILMLRDPFAELVCIAVTMASMVSVVGRNYGSPIAVNLQTMSACLPIMLGCLMLGDFYMTLLSIFLIPFALTTRMMANGVREFLYKNVIASREIAMIADRFDTALNNMPHGLFMLDRNNRIQVVNSKASELLNLGDQNRLKDCDLDVVLRYGVRHTFIDGSLPALIQRQLAQLIDGTLSRSLIQFSDELALEFTANRKADGGVVLIFEDVTARVRAERKILHMARYDSLTGLPNREYFVELVQDKLRERPDVGTVGFVILDVDEFKHVNDLKGHVAGDRLLHRIAKRLKTVAGSDTIQARLMGDQFVVFFPDADDAASLDQRIRTMHAEVCGDYDVDGHRFRISFSCGYVVMESDEVRMDEWQIKADLALFETKSRARGYCTAFEPEMDARYVEQQKLKADLRDAVENKRLHVDYQPMYKPDGSRIECCEALARWIHPEKGTIPPNVFIQIAEEMGIISGITEFVVERACRDCTTWPNHMSVSVNLSVQDLRNADIVAIVCAALEKSGLDPARLHLEVTESSIMDELVTVRAILADLRSRGITIAIDDFGTGFSSLSYLDSLPVDIVKIDRSFVRNIGEDSRRFKLLRGTVNLSRELGLKIVIEGVETKDQLALINAHRCADYIQGYVFSMPVATEAVIVLSDALRRKRVARRRESVA
ncbi:EAL domain-containing protein [Rhizobiaceae bacterium n13]|uniref:EAL domain-containing protein n=1 Tax=Ferirhizobium litorale TaxID=2927786 RepID=A0AAE3Q7D1_9HYPH|nr:EAL domain-containing protein [Fererhizobium litorale]MDI7860467.1 EAL domain-containing protein [Fererhizobium litorale]MDI7920602.1 EAL domain-containing protein [Fererhizobium litorale]